MATRKKSETVTAIHPVDQVVQNRLAMMMEGKNPPDIIRPAPMLGRVSQLWSPFIAGNNSYARKGTTGAEVAQILCAHGYLKYSLDGTIYEAGTNIQEQPSWEDVRKENSLFAFIKTPPTRDEFNSIIRAGRSTSKADVEAAAALLLKA